MAKVKITGHASGTGVITVTAPNTSTDRTITLPDSTGTLLDSTSTLDATKVSGTHTSFASTGIDDNANATAITIDSNKGVGIKNTNSDSFVYKGLVVGDGGSSDQGVNIYSSAWGALTFADATSGVGRYEGSIAYNHATNQMAIATNHATAMTIDANGIVTKPKQPAFDAHSTSDAYSSGTSVSSLNLNATRINVGGHYNTSNDRFTAPVAGVYHFNYRTIVNGAVTTAHVRMHKNGSIIDGTDSHYTSDSGGWSTWTYSSLILLAANDYVSVFHTSAASIHGNDYQSFNGHLIG